MTTVRRSAAALAATAVLLAGGAGAVAQAAPAPSPAPVLPSGLYGKKDPTYDGVWRQSLAFMAQETSGVEPAEKAVAWLLGQQCDSGAFASYRPDPAKTCDPTTMLDTNATAVAVQALAGLDKPETEEGKTDPVTMAVQSGAAWLKGVQNKDGGWSYNPGGASDANSTSIVISGLAAAGEKPGAVKSSDGRTPYDALLSFAIPCDAPQGPGAFAYQPDKDGRLVANGDATAAAVLAGLGKHFQTRGAKPDQPPTCEKGAKATAERAARNGASYLVTALAPTGHLDLPPMPGAAATAPQPDFGNTADAVVALGAAGHSDKTAGAIEWLSENSAGWAAQNGPAAWAQLIFAAHTVGADTRDFGGVDLVAKLNATGPAPRSTVETRAQEEEDQKKEENGESSGFSVWLIIAIFLAVGMGIGFLLSGRKNRQL
ncbi:prenyltransferase/squalene oxidase repeat-containing protein [Streptomyces sp. SP18CS02]|uniref:prenyltransferase/squalene oxidase repeat-containing protein n=1 Tax=Streptomyces sp. SP18CS02 TaxID=3002531 RepID=UPI002E787812|nr:prenyltransferase/squalene oxidase repeat-containing protein [Streptomyces sp. SP18CS02]MEE1753270.1 terpene cyclase/mutase family protein [Streptomyces sp. SP18CS02]